MFTSGMHASLGRILLTLPLLATLIAPALADWNDSHVFNPHWMPHARFHSVIGTCGAMAWAAVGLWSLWRKSSDRAVSDALAALPPIFYWGFFFIALLVPGTSFEDPGHHLFRVFGLVPVNIFVAGVNTIVAAVAWLLLWKERRR